MPRGTKFAEPWALLSQPWTPGVHSLTFTDRQTRAQPLEVTLCLLSPVCSSCYRAVGQHICMFWSILLVFSSNNCGIPTPVPFWRAVAVCRTFALVGCSGVSVLKHADKHLALVRNEVSDSGLSFPIRLLRWRFIAKVCVCVCKCKASVSKIATLVCLWVYMCVCEVRSMYV